MVSRNDITGDNISSKQNSDKFRSGWDAIWGGSSEEDSTKKETTAEGDKEKKDDESDS